MQKVQAMQAHHVWRILRIRKPLLLIAIVIMPRIEFSPYLLFSCKQITIMYAIFLNPQFYFGMETDKMHAKKFKQKKNSVKMQYQYCGKSTK